MTNYEYISNFVTREVASRGPLKVLDYGCGAGEIVRLLRNNGVDAFGCDPFYGGGDRSGSVPPELLNRTIFRMENGRIPFGDGTFDMVFSNQVFEHVQDLNAVLLEVSRVLKDDGKVLSLFPHLGTWREGHCGIPWLHWFPKRSRIRVYYAFLMRSMGLGSRTERKTPMQWAKDFCAYLDNWTYYRSYAEINQTFARDFNHPEHFEDDWISTRWPRMRFLPRWSQRLIALKGGGLIFVCRKRATAGDSVAR